MKGLFSPASIITYAGGILSVVGLTAYFTAATNLSVPTFFYGVPIFLIGLSLKTGEIAPVLRLTKPSEFQSIREKSAPELTKLLADVTRWRYGQSAHLESSLKSLRLWNIDNPPQLLEVEELEINGGYGIRMRFDIGGVSISRWEEKQERLGRFFAKGLNAELIPTSQNLLDLKLLPITSSPESNS